MVSDASFLAVAHEHPDNGHVNANDQLLIREALRLFQRYNDDIVNALGLCPYAEQAWQKDQVARHVVVDPSPSFDKVIDIIDAVAANPQLHIGFIIFPRKQDNSAAFEQWVNQLRQQYIQRHGTQSVPMAMVGFHPEVTVDLSTPSTLIPLLRCTPDPTLQIIRLATLDKLRQANGEGTVCMTGQLQHGRERERERQPIHARIAQTNYDTVVCQHGINAVLALLQDIQADRARSYQHVK